VRSPHTARACAKTIAVLLAVSPWVAGCGGSRAPDAMLDGGSTTDACRDTGLFCEGTRLRECNGDVVQTVIDCADLGQTCSRSRCTSFECAELERKPSGAKGCLFYAAGLSNLVADAGQTRSLLVANGANTAVKVELQGLMPAGARAWVRLAGETVSAGASHRFRAPYPGLAIDTVNPRSAVRIDSERPVTVVQIESDDADEAATNSAGTMLLPVNSLGRGHMVMTYPQRAIAAVAAVGGGEGPGRVVVIGTERGTKVTFKAAGVSAPAQEVEIDEGDVVQFWSEAEGQDLSGSTVDGTKRIAVFSGNLTTTYGRELGDVVSSPDMALEQMLPLVYWSRTHVAAALPPQASTCDGLLGLPGASYWRVTADHNETLVTFDGPKGAMLPASFTLDAGQTRDFVVQDASFTVRGTEPVMVTQGMDCEPTLSLAVPVDQMLNELAFPVLPNFAQMAAVVRKRDGGPVMFDNSFVTAFQPAGTDYEVAYVPIAPCPTEVGVCTHRLSGEFGMTLRGMDVVCSYALTVPSWMGCDPLDPVICTQ
jgi:hypothetical protein